MKYKEQNQCSYYFCPFLPNDIPFENEAFIGLLSHLQLDTRNKNFGVWKTVIWTWLWQLLTMQVAWLLPSLFIHRNA